MAVATWTGFYAGVNVGYGWEDPTATFTPTEDTGASILNGLATNRSPVSPPTSFDVKGAAGGVQFGYNQQFERWLAGIEVDFSGSGIKGEGAAALLLVPGLPPGGRTAIAQADEQVKWFGTVRARLGYLATPDLLVFGTVGFAFGKVDHHAAIIQTGGLGFTLGGAGAVTCSPGAACYAGSTSRTATGWTAGGGIEYAIMRNWTLKAEYLYVNLGRDAFGINGTVITPPNPGPVAVSYTDTHFNLVRIGANYRF